MDSNDNEQPTLIVGKINGLFGINGMVKVFSYCDPITNIINYDSWIIKNNESTSTYSVIGKKHAKNIIAKLLTIDNVEQATELLNADICLKTSQLPKLTDGYYYYQLEGLEVINTDGFYFGKVDYLFNTGSNSVLVINSKKMHYIPFIKPYLVKVDLPNKTIIIDWDPNF